jgi:hypothetical protein
VIFDNYIELRSRGWRPLGALIIASPYDYDIPAGPADAFCRDDSSERPCDEPPVLIIPAIESSLDGINSVPLAFITAQDGQKIHQWFGQLGDSDVATATASQGE